MRVHQARLIDDAGQHAAQMRVLFEEQQPNAWSETMWKKIGISVGAILLAIVVGFSLLSNAAPEGRPESSHYVVEEGGVEDAKEQEDVLLRMFEKEYPKGRAKSPGSQRQDDIRAYILNCCKSEEAALQLLKKNGFEIVRTTDPAKIAEFNKEYRQSKEYWAKESPEYVIEDYDTFVLAKKSARRWENFMNVHAEYRVHLFVRNQKVSWVTVGMELNPFNSTHFNKGTE